MPIGDIEFTKMSLCNIETGEEVMKVDGIQEVTLEQDESIREWACDGKGNRLFPFYQTERTLTVDFENEISEEQMKKIIGFDPSNFSDAYDITFQKFVQARKHKKRRINKKWLKRYGYKIVNVETKGWKVHTSTNGEIVFQQ